jgi:outer membrane protein assembly factor BamA
LDLRDSNLSPTKGWYLVATHEISNPSLLSQNEPFPVAYTRSTLRSDFFIPLPASIVGFFSLRTGYQVNQAIPPADRQNDLRYAIPLSRQFALGGNASLRGFREQSLNLERIAIRGSASYVNYRSQLEIPFVGQLKAGPFLDAANLQVDSYSLGNLRYGAGFGFRYRSPVGPINFDWGFNIRPEPGEDTNRFHFSIGIL